MSKKLYLLAGNGGAAAWWDDTLPHFQHYEPLPLELPGFGDNPLPPGTDLDACADALLAATERGSAIVAVGINALLVMHALQRRPGHFSRSVLMSPVGAYLWQRRLPALMSWQPLRRIIHWALANRPHWFARKFSRRRWTAAQYKRMGDGYRRCRAFLSYWDIFRADNALNLLEWVEDPIELVWGMQDAVLASSHAAAWSAILARAELRVEIRETWGHYPWIDEPQTFVEWLESGALGFVAHDKGGRLQLAQLAGLPVPAALTVDAPTDTRIPGLLGEFPDALWAVRSSALDEDQADHANAGLHQSFLRVPASEVGERASRLFASGIEHVVVQRFVEPQVSGIAFIRNIAIEVEWVQGHLEALADGRIMPQRAILSRMGGEWCEDEFPTQSGLTQAALEKFLRRVLHVFHYVHGDIEWAWDGRQLWLLQYRPISAYDWRRHLTAANIAEILPPRPSRLVDYALSRSAGSVPNVIARWDSRVLEDNEPFIVRHAGALYINNDYILARLHDWGMSFSRYAGQVGGSAPAHAPALLRLLLSLPRLWRMQRQARLALAELESKLRRFDDELAQLAAAGADGQTLADWLVRFQCFVVPGNLHIATALSSNFGAWLGRPATVYRSLQDSRHRLPWETDPATVRAQGPELPLQPFPAWSLPIHIAHRIGLPGMRGYYLQVREWYRDNLMRIFFRLHHAMPMQARDYWFAPVDAERTQSGSFWQDGHSVEERTQGFVIYPGVVSGVLGQDILFEETLDPGRYETYRQASAVVARMGGRLSHGATLLRELRKPSAVIPDFDPAWLGQAVEYRNGVLHRPASAVFDKVSVAP